MYSVSNDPFAHFNRIVAEEAGGNILKYSKGDWYHMEQKLNGATMVADVTDLAHGFRKWENKQIVDSRVGLVAAGFVPPRREELGDDDSSLWPMGPDGSRVDPWAFGYFLRLTAEDGTSYVWTAGSAGARRAVGDLIRAFSRRRRNPNVTLESDSYKHGQFGRVSVPLLKIIGWAEDEPALPAPTSRTPALSGPNGRDEYGAGPQEAPPHTVEDLANIEF
jgi:hypothetical protein